MEAQAGASGTRRRRRAGVLLAALGVVLLPGAVEGWMGLGSQRLVAKRCGPSAAGAEGRAARGLVRMEARKRSKVRAGQEELQYFDQLLSADMGVQPEEWVDDLGEDMECIEEDDEYLVRDRRFMRLSEDERAYYERLNAYRGDRELPPVVVVDSSRVLPAGQEEAVLPEAYSPEWYVAQMTRRNDEGKPNLALLLWDKLRRGEGLPDRRPQPTLGSYGQAMRACHLMGDLPMAKRLLRELREQGVVDMYTAGLDWAVRLLARSRRYVEAIRLLEETALAPGVRLRVSSFNILMEELAGIRRWREVPKVLTLMSAYRLHPNADSFCLVITAHVALGNMKEATRVLAEMGERGLAPSDGFVETWSGLMRRGELGPATEDEGGEGLAGMAPS